MRKSLIILLFFVIISLISISGNNKQFSNLNFDYRTCSLSSEPLFFSQSNQILESDNSSENIKLSLSKGECLLQTNLKIKSADTFYLLDFPSEKFCKSFSSRQPPLTSFYSSTSNKAPPGFC